MIEYTSGDLLAADTEALVNPVNTSGHMGKGLALEVRRRYPANYKAYRAAALRGELVVGKMMVWEEATLQGRRVVINFPTKRHWRGNSRLEYIDEGLLDLRRVLVEREIRSVAVPALGCGLGGLRWVDVRPRVEAALSDLVSTRVLVYESGQSDC